MQEKLDALLMAPVLPDISRAFLEKHTELDYAFIDSPLPDMKTNILCCPGSFQGRLYGRKDDASAQCPGGHIHHHTDA